MVSGRMLRIRSHRGNNARGVLELMSPIYIVITLGCGLIIVANALRKKKYVSYFVSVGSLGLLILCSVTFVGERMVEVQNDIIVCMASIVENRDIYKEQFIYDRAFDIIEESSGSHFDPSLCRTFLQCRLPIETLYNRLYRSFFYVEGILKKFPNRIDSNITS